MLLAERETVPASQPFSQRTKNASIEAPSSLCSWRVQMSEEMEMQLETPSAQCVSVSDPQQNLLLDLPKETFIRLLDHLPVETVFILRALCRSVRPVAAEHFCKSVASLVKDGDNVVLIELIVKIRDETTQDLLGYDQFPLQPESLGQLLVRCGMPVQSAFMLEVAWVSNLNRPDDLGRFLRAIQAPPRLLRTFLDCYRVLSHYDVEDAVKVLEATGLERKILVDHVIQRLQGNAAAVRWSLQAEIEKWFQHPTWVPTQSSTSEALAAGLASLFKWFDNADQDIYTLSSLAGIIAAWQNGPLAAVIRHCPWPWHHRGELAMTYCKQFDDDGNDDDDEEDDDVDVNLKVSRLLQFLVSFFTLDAWGSTVSVDDRRAFFSGAAFTYRDRLMQEDSPMKHLEMFLFDGNHPITAALQPADFIAIGPSGIKDMFLVDVMRSSTQLDFDRFLAFLRAVKPHHDTICRVFNRLNEPRWVPNMIKVLQAIEAPLKVFADLLIRRSAKPSFSEADILWYPWAEPNGNEPLSISDLAQSLAFAVVLLCQVNKRHQIRATLARIGKILVAKAVGKDGALSKDQIALLSITFVTTLEEEGLAPAEALGHLGALIGCESVVPLGLFSAAVTNSVVIQISFRKFGELRNFLLGLQIGGGEIGISNLEQCDAWTWQFTRLGLPRNKRLKGTRLEIVGMTMEIKPEQRKELFVSGLWQKLPLLNVQTFGTVPGVAKKLELESKSEKEKEADFRARRGWIRETLKKCDGVSSSDLEIALKVRCNHKHRNSL